MAHTTIPIDPKVRDRLRRFGMAGETYNEILTRLMDDESERLFTSDLSRRFRSMREDDWAPLEDTE